MYCRLSVECSNGLVLNLNSVSRIQYTFFEILS